MTGKQNGRSNGKKKNKPVLCVETGVVYPSATDASALTGVERSNIGSCCRGTREKAGGYHWQFAEVK
jgi:hypothetical protein